MGNFLTTTATTLVLMSSVSSSFVLPHPQTQTQTRHLSRYPTTHLPSSITSLNLTPQGEKHHHHHHHIWTPQDLTQNNPTFPPIPENDYIKLYQQNPELWPVEFFLLAYRRRTSSQTKKVETQVLVRKSANHTSKYGLGTGVPATRWVLSTLKNPPLGYKWSEPTITFDARNYPEFPRGCRCDASWSYRKIDIREDAFCGVDTPVECRDNELEDYARRIWMELKRSLSNDEEEENESTMSSWDASVVSTVNRTVNNPNCIAAIQGTLRMSGLFQQHRTKSNSPNTAPSENRHHPRYIPLDDNKNTPDPSKLIKSMRIYTMFPQMPDPMPLPSTSPKQLQEEICTRPSRMSKSGRNPHQDKYGRVYTHISTSNVSNTIHGVYFTLDVTDILEDGLEEEDVCALDLFGDKGIEREWVSLEDLKVLDVDGESLGVEDTKGTFISGFIVRQLVKEGVIDIFG